MTDPYAALEAANIGLANVLSYRTYSGSRAPGKVEWDSAQRALDLVRAALDARQEAAPRHKPLTDEQIDAAPGVERGRGCGPGATRRPRRRGRALQRRPVLMRQAPNAKLNGGGVRAITNTYDRDAETLETELAICREAIEVCLDVVENLPSDDDGAAAVKRCTLRRLNEAIGKATPRLMMERPEGQKMYGLNYREMRERIKALEAAFRDAGCEKTHCRYPECVENGCPRWISGECAGPPG